jgi:dienelactone hydrolase
MTQPENGESRARRLAGPRDVTTPFVRAREFMRQPAEHHDDLPLARPTIAVARQVFHDELVMLGMRMFTPVGNTATPGRIDREVTEALAFYGGNGWLENPEGFFAAPPPLTEVISQPVTIRRQTMQMITFDSGYEPHPGEPGRDRWLSYTANRRESALLLRHSAPRPWVVCVHGALMGRGSVDLRLFRARHLHEQLGLNVLLPVMPLHGPRKSKGAAWPGQDVLDDVHAAAQAVWDIRRLISWIRAQEPDSKIGVNGMSLGGYVSSLVASVQDGLTCAVLGVPVADLLEVLGGAGGLGPDDPRQLTLDKARPLGRMVSPLSMTPKVPMAGRFIYGGVADRLVNPRDQVLKLWEHWGRPEVHWYQGAHTGFFRSRPVQDFIDGALRQSGLTAH